MTKMHGSMHRFAPRSIGSIVLASVVGLTPGCATGIRSSPLTPGVAAPQGLAYFLPKRDITVTVVVADGKEDEVTVTVTDAFPDSTAGFVATIPRNDVGTVDSTIQTNEKGLLDSDSTTSVASSLTDILSKLAGIGGTLRVAEAMPRVPAKECAAAGTYRRTFGIGADGRTTGSICQHSIVVERVIAASRMPADASNAALSKQQGLFYRVPIPYVVSVTRDAVTRQYVVYSPTGSPTYFLPLARSTFATNTATLGFKDGVPTKYKQAIGNEAVGLLSMPATVIESYFGAIGSMFTRRKELSDKEVAYLNQLNSASVAEARRASCAKVASESTSVEEIKRACSN